MTDLPEKDEIVERLTELMWGSELRNHDDHAGMEEALDALTVPDLLALLRERGARYRDWYRSEGFYGERWDNCVLTVPAKKDPDD